MSGAAIAVADFPGASRVENQATSGWQERAGGWDEVFSVALSLGLFPLKRVNLYLLNSCNDVGIFVVIP